MPYRRVQITRFGGPEVLELVEETTLPEPGPGEVRVRVLAAGVAFTDTLVREGSYPDVKDEPPFTPGYDMVGVVDALGDGVDGVVLGQKVADLTVIGAYSEYLCCAADRLVPVPDALDAADATALILSYVTAYQLLHRVAEVEAGQRVLVHGAGGAVGTAALQLGRLAGVELIGTASAGKRAHVEALGAAVIDYRSEDFVERVAQLAPDGVDVVLDGVGPQNARRSVRALRPGGRLVLFGASGGDMGSLGGKLRLAANSIGLLVRSVFTRRKLAFYSIASLRSKQPDWFREDLTALFDLAARGELTPAIGRRLGLDEIVEAHELIDAFAVEGKIVVTMA
ncbi:MAG: medium chain dehydrogenase/reductase family protein [Actinomycetota bacterium]